MSYVRQSTWIEFGPRPRPAGSCAAGLRGLGDICPTGQVFDTELQDCIPGSGGNSVTVTGCAPDLCLRFPFPWVGRRTEIPAGTAPPVDWAETAPSPCYCKPVFDVGNVGKYVTWGLVGLFGLGIVRGVMR